jgi:hypothetical protein
MRIIYTPPILHDKLRSANPRHIIMSELCCLISQEKKRTNYLLSRGETGLNRVLSINYPRGCN